MSSRPYRNLEALHAAGFSGRALLRAWTFTASAECGRTSTGVSATSSGAQRAGPSTSATGILSYTLSRSHQRTRRTVSRFERSANQHRGRFQYLCQNPASQTETHQIKPGRGRYTQSSQHKEHESKHHENESQHAGRVSTGGANSSNWYFFSRSRGVPAITMDS